MRTTRHSTRIATIAVVPILALTGCGGDDGEDAATGTGTEATGTAPAAEGSVSFESPADGDTVSSPVTLEMAAEGVTITVE